MNNKIYKTQLKAGLGLIPETFRIFEIWEPGINAKKLYKGVLKSGSFPNISAKRLQNIIFYGFATRYLIEETKPAQNIKKLINNISSNEMNQLMFLYTCRANEILKDFLNQVYWEIYQAGVNTVSRLDSIEFVENAVSKRLTISDWSEYTIKRVSSDLLGVCADFKLLGNLERGKRNILPFSPSPLTVSYLAHDIHFPSRKLQTS